MFRATMALSLALALLISTMPSARAGMDARIDPRAVNLNVRDFPPVFGQTFGLFTTDSSGKLDDHVVYGVSLGGGKILSISSFVTIYPTIKEAMTSCCTDLGPSHWWNQSPVFKTPRIGEVGYTLQSYVDSNGEVTQQILFRQGSVVIAMQYYTPLLRPDPSSVMMPGLFVRLAQLVDQRIKEAKPALLSSLLAVFEPAPPLATRQASGTSKQLDLYVGLDQDPRPYNAYLLLHAEAPYRTRCTLNVAYRSGRKRIVYNWPSREVPLNQTLWWPWHEDTPGSGGTATVQCTLGRQTGEAQVRYRLAV